MLTSRAKGWGLVIVCLCTRVWAGEPRLDFSVADACKQDFARLSDHFADFDEADRAEILAHAERDAAVAERLLDRLRAASVLDAPLPLFERLVQKANSLPPGTLTQEQAARVVAEAFANIEPQGRELLVQSLVEASSQPRPFSVPGLRGRLTDRAQTQILDTLSQVEAQTKVNQPTKESEPDLTWLSELVSNSLDPNDTAKFLVELERSQPAVRKAIYRELEAVAKNERTAKKVADEVRQISPIGPSMNVRVLYGVDEGKVRLISARLNIKAGRDGHNTRQNEWISQGEAAWRSFLE